MPSVPHAPKPSPSPGLREAPYFAEYEQHRLRTALFREIRKRGTYRNAIAQDLRPTWTSAFPALGPAGETWSFYYLVTHPRATALSAVVSYVNAVQCFTAQTLRLTANGEPAPWAVAYVHEDVEPRGGRPSGSFAF